MATLSVKASIAPLGTPDFSVTTDAAEGVGSGAV